MSEFIKLDIDLSRCLGIEKCGKCIQVCPVNIFTSNVDYPKAVKANEDECTLCDLCLQGCEADAITIQKLYEE
ncbi:MAG: ferredoxin [Desulfobacteraceae bacterium]|nr:ferredoxin [Desulfobacteraceae bacterium]